MTNGTSKVESLDSGSMERTVRVDSWEVNPLILVRRAIGCWGKELRQILPDVSQG